MTGYAVTFNKRHKRAGHLFQNRYKSVVCEENAYLLELIRYIHLNPLRAGLVKDLQELDKYSTILGNRKNPLLPEGSDQKPEVSEQASARPCLQGFLCSDSDLSSRIRTNQQPAPFASLAPLRFNDKPLAEKTIEDILLHFGETKRASIKRYREFVEKGIKQGTREDLRGGGLIRSAGGDVSGLLGRKAEEREKGDARILGSGDFVMQALDRANEIFERNANKSISLGELIRRITRDRKVDSKDLLSSKRTQQISDARAIISYLAAIELKNTGTKIASHLGLSEKSVSRCIERGKKLLDKDEGLLDYLQ